MELWEFQEKLCDRLHCSQFLVWNILSKKGSWELVQARQHKMILAAASGGGGNSDFTQRTPCSLSAALWKYSGRTTISRLLMRGIIIADDLACCFDTNLTLCSYFKVFRKIMTHCMKQGFVKTWKRTESAMHRWFKDEKRFKLKKRTFARPWLMRLVSLLATALTIIGPTKWKVRKISRSCFVSKFSAAP